MSWWAGFNPESEEPSLTDYRLLDPPPEGPSNKAKKQKKAKKKKKKKKMSKAAKRKNRR
jgi:hypothetical protein